MRALPEGRTRRLDLALAAAAGVALAAAAAGAPPFSHRFHLEELGASCRDCHDVDDQTQRLPVLRTEACVDCHDETPSWRLPGRARRLDAAYPHRRHAAVLECTECHRSVAGDAALADQPLLPRSTCVGCHAERGIAIADTRCATCHGVDKRTQPPADHGHTWLARHGIESRWRVYEDHGKACADCHGGDVCVSCHRARRPRDHTALWRIRMHGSAAAWDRDRCKTCHETGTCVRCHQNTVPFSHRGAWSQSHGFAAGGYDANCQICHAPAWCRSCHSGGRQ